MRGYLCRVSVLFLGAKMLFSFHILACILFSLPRAASAIRHTAVAT